MGSARTPTSPRIAVLVSDHGWGHLNRTLEWASGLVTAGASVLLGVSPAMVPAVERGLPGARVLAGRLDRGLLAGAGGVGVDLDVTRALMRESVGGPEPELTAAIREWAPDLVAADATPWAPSVATACGVPAVMVSNFTWGEQYAGLFGAHDPDVRCVVREEERFDRGLRLPFGTPLGTIALVEDGPVVARLSREANGLDADATRSDGPTVVWAMGRTPVTSQPLAALDGVAEAARAVGGRLVVSETVARARPGLTQDSSVEAIPEESDWSTVLAGAHVTVSKAGYSTICETLMGRGYVAVIGGTGTVEEAGMMAEVERRDVGIALAGSDPDAAVRLAAGVRTLLARPAREPLSRDGGEQIARRLMEMATPRER